MTGPMSQVGWASACSRVTWSSSSRRRPRNGPPLAVTTSRRTSSRDPARRHCAIAVCSESTGTIWPGLARAATSGPPAINDSLFAKARVRPASRAARVGASPTDPVIPFRTTSHGHAATSVGGVGTGQQLRQLVTALAVAASLRFGVQRELEVLERAGAGDRDDLHSQVDGLRGEQVGPPASGSQADDPQPVARRLHHVDRLGPDRAGRPEQHHVARHAAIVAEPAGDLVRCWARRGEIGGITLPLWPTHSLRTVTSPPRSQDRGRAS